MLTIPSIKPGFGPWKFKCYGPVPKMIKFLTEEIVKTTLMHEKIKKKDVIIDIIFKKEDEIAIDHKKYLHKDGPTDTISLIIDNESLYEKDVPTMLGMIILCWPVIKDDADFIKQNHIKHLAHIVVHSTLHLLGYDHETEKDRQSMEAKEERILCKLGVNSPYLNHKTKFSLDCDII